MRLVILLLAATALSCGVRSSPDGAPASPEDDASTRARPRARQSVTIDLRGASVRSVLDELERQSPDVHFQLEESDDWPRDLRTDFVVREQLWCQALQELMRTLSARAEEPVPGIVRVRRVRTTFSSSNVEVGIRSAAELFSRVLGVSISVDPDVRGRLAVLPGGELTTRDMRALIEAVPGCALIQFGHRSWRIARRSMPAVPLEEMLADLEPFAHEPDTAAAVDIARLLGAIDDTTIDERERATLALRAYGAAAITAVKRAWKLAESVEVRWRLAGVIAALHEALAASHVIWTGRHAVDARRGTVVWSAPADARDAAADEATVTVTDGKGRTSVHRLRDGRALEGAEREAARRGCRPPVLAYELRASVGNGGLRFENFAGRLLWHRPLPDRRDRFRTLVRSGAVYTCSWIDGC